MIAWPRRILRTTAVRLALRYALLYALILGLSFLLLAWSVQQQVDGALRETLHEEMAELMMRANSEDLDLLRGVIATRAQAGIETGRVYLLIDNDGQPLAGNLPAWPKLDLPRDGKIRHLWLDEEMLPEPLADDDGYWPLLARELDGAALLLGQRVEQDEALQELSEFLTTVMAVATALALIMALTLGWGILKRMAVIERTAGEIMGGDLSRRIPLSPRRDEFDALAERLNEMLDRIQRLVKGIREVSDNVAHDLRSPLTRLRNRLEVTLLEPRSAADYQEALRQGIADAESLITTFNALLSIAQAESGHLRSEWQQVELNPLAEALVELYRPVAEEKGQRLELCQSDGNVGLTGSRDLLAQAIGNLLENAIKYTPEQGRISLSVSAHRSASSTGEAARAIEISVSDNGPGIPAAERAHVLERFVRLEQSRHTPGNGLGLSLVQAVTQLHRGRLSLEDAGPGLRVRLLFG